MEKAQATAPSPAGEAENEIKQMDPESAEITTAAAEPITEVAATASAEAEEVPQAKEETPAEVEAQKTPAEEEVAHEAEALAEEPATEEAPVEEELPDKAETSAEEPSAEETLVEEEVPDKAETLAEEPAAEETPVEERVADEVDALAEEPAAEETSVEEEVPDKAEISAEEPEPEEEEEIDDGRAWFVVHSYSGYENKVKQNLEQRIESMNMQDRIFKVVVPTEEEIEIREGHRRKTKKRVFPGYVLVQMIMDEESWYAVRNTPGVTGFVGVGTKPSPLRPEEADKIFKRMEREAPKIKVSFREGQTVRIVDGPFADFVGTVEELNLDKGKVRVLVSFFGRETPVELDFLQVQKQ
jgi:transcriptional antiterminator NusG